LKTILQRPISNLVMTKSIQQTLTKTPQPKRKKDCLRAVLIADWAVTKLTYQKRPFGNENDQYELLLTLWLPETISRGYCKDEKTGKFTRRSSFIFDMVRNLGLSVISKKSRNWLGVLTFYETKWVFIFQKILILTKWILSSSIIWLSPYI
jgi:hypothetical protein